MTLIPVKFLPRRKYSCKGRGSMITFSAVIDACNR